MKKNRNFKIWPPKGLKIVARHSDGTVVTLKGATIGFWVISLAVIGGIVSGITIPIYNSIQNKIVSVEFDFNSVKKDRIYGDNWDSTFKNNIKAQAKKRNGAVFDIKTSDLVIDDYSKDAGEQNIYVSYSGFKESFKLITIPADISTPIITLNKNILSWNSIEHSSGYKFYYGDNEQSLTHTLDLHNVTSFDVSEVDFSGDYCFAIQAIKENNNYHDSSLSNVISKKKVASINNVNYNGTSFTWNAVSNADKYIININGTNFETVSNYYNYDLTVGKTDVAVYGLSNNNEFIQSKACKKNITKLDGFKNIKLENDYLSWDKIEHATNYQIYLDGDLKGTFPNNYFSLSSYSSGAHNIELKALGENGDVISSSSGIINLIIGFSLNISNKKLEWSNVGSYTYDVYKDDQIYTTTTNNYLDISDDSSLSDGIYYFYVKIKNKDCLGSNTNKIIVSKLSAPSLSIQNETLITSNPINVKYYLDGEIFDGDISNLSAGDHSIKALNTSTEDNILNSNWSNTISLTKLSQPTISLSSTHDSIDVTGGLSNLKFYSDNIEFDGQLNSLSSGMHNITAKNCSSSSSELSSVVSNTISINKLKTPSISRNGVTLSNTDATSGFKYLNNGIVFDGDLIALTSGQYTIVGKNFGEETNEVNSNSSNEITVNKIVVDFSKQSKDYYQAAWNDGPETQYNITIDFYLSGTKIDTVEYSNLSTKYQNISFVRSGKGTADKCKILAKPVDQSYSSYLIYGECENK